MRVNGQWQRIDYIGVSLSAEAWVGQAWTSEDVTLAIADQAACQEAIGSGDAAAAAGAARGSSQEPS